MNEEDLLRITTSDGKYTVVQHSNGALEALRYGEAWRSLIGDNLVLVLAQDLEREREHSKMLQNKLNTLNA